MSRLFVDHLTVIDFSYLDAERGLVGESWIVDLELDGELNAQGMVFDFGPVKKQIKAAIDSGMDHRFVIPRGLPGLLVSTEGTTTRVQWANLARGLVLDYRAPHQAFYWLDATAVTAQVARIDMVHNLKAVVPDNVKTIGITLRTELQTGVFYHYSHGLKKHDGDCQRMIHGHRSRLQILNHQQPALEYEQQIAQSWQDIYLVTRADIIETRQVQGINCYHMRYSAQQGQFELTWPVNRCDVLETDTTVELIAEHLLAKVTALNPTTQWTVKAYEGVHKGAYAGYLEADSDQDLS